MFGSISGTGVSPGALRPPTLALRLPGSSPPTCRLGGAPWMVGLPDTQSASGPLPAPALQPAVPRFLHCRHLHVAALHPLELCRGLGQGPRAAGAAGRRLPTEVQGSQAASTCGPAGQSPGHLSRRPWMTPDLGTAPGSRALLQSHHQQHHLCAHPHVASENPEVEHSSDLGTRTGDRNKDRVAGQPVGVEGIGRSPLSLHTDTFPSALRGGGGLRNPLHLEGCRGRRGS